MSAKIILQYKIILVFFNFVQCRPQFPPLDVFPAKSQFASPSKDHVVYRDGDVYSVEGRNFWTDPRYRWPNGRIPYTISSSYSNGEREIIINAMQEWETKTCVRFTPKGPNDFDYVEITPNDGTSSYCYSYVGRQGNRQLMKMYGECLRSAAMIHELGHVIGFNHEHQRPDRDDFINVYLQNINPAYHYAFDRFDRGVVDNLGTSYDYSSVMQYPFYAFTDVYDPNRPAMTTKDGSIGPIENEAQQLSTGDIRKVQIYYNNCSK